MHVQVPHPSAIPSTPCPGAAPAGSKELGVQLDAGVVERLNAYSRSVAHFPTAVKEFQWRNGWFYAISQKAAAAGLPDPMPMHTALLKEVGAI
jgi:hypothetical protein